MVDQATLSARLAKCSDDELVLFAELIRKEQLRRWSAERAFRARERNRKTAEAILEQANADPAFNPKAVAWARKVLSE